MQTHHKEIMLLRHGQAVNNPVYTDYQRPLSATGMAQSQRLGQRLLEEKYFPQSVLSSPARRAQQTSELVCQQLMIPASGIHYDDILYLASAQVYLDSLRRFSCKYRRIMLVGHNAGLEDLLAVLTNEDEQPVHPSTLLVLSVNGDWKDIAPGQCRLLRRFDQSTAKL